MNVADWGALQPVRYDFAISYSSRDVALVRPVVEGLVARGYRVFEYVDALAQAWGRDLAGHLDEIFEGSAACYVVFLSEAYLKGRWTTHEWARMRSSPARGSGGDIAIVRLDESNLDLERRCTVLEDGCSGWMGSRRAVDLLVEQLIALEGVEIPQAAASGPFELLGVSLRAIDRDACLRRDPSRTLAGGLIVRFPPDLHALYAGVRRALREGWPWPSSQTDAEALLQTVQTTTASRIGQGIALLISCSSTVVWRREDLVLGAEAFFLAECFRVVRALAAFADLFDDEFRHARPYLQLRPSSGSVAMREALPWVTQDDEESISFWTDVDLYDARAEAPALRKWIMAPSEMYLPREFQCEPHQFMRFIVPQLIDRSLDTADDALLRCLLSDPGRVDLQPREEWLIDTVKYRHVSAEQRSPAIADARAATERRLRSLIESGRLDDGLEHVRAEHRLHFHLGRMPFSKAERRP
jgi:hypothetical protein